MTNIEKLQQKVETIKTDLDNLKSEVSVEVKKQKEKETFDKIKNAKEEINLKIDELKKLGEEKNSNEIQKLQEMLISLDAQSKLKIEVITEQSKSPKEKWSEVEFGKAWEKTPDEIKKNWFKRQRDGFSDSTEENHVLKNTARIAWGVGIAVLAYKWLKRLFGGEKKKDDAEKKPEDTEKKSRWKKALTRGGIWVGWVLAWKNRDKIKDWFGNLFWSEDKNSPEKQARGDFEYLSEDMKSKYYTISNDIDVSSKSDIPTFDSSPEEDKNKKSEIIFEIDKKTKNLSEFNSAATLDYIQWETTDGFFAKIKNWGKWLLYDTLWWFLSKIESFHPLGTKFLQNPAEAVEEWLKGGTPWERRKQLSLFYREYMNILSYVTNKKEIILAKKAKEKIMWTENISKEPTEDQKDLIHNLIKNDAWRDDQLQQIRISDIPTLMKTYTIEVNDISEDTKIIRKKLQEEKNDILKIDNDGSAIIRAEIKNLDWGFDKETRNELIDVCESLWDDLFGKEWKLWFIGAYTHLLTDIFAWNTELAKGYMKQMQRDGWISDLQVTLESYIAKLKSNTFTKQDLQDLKVQTDVYFERKQKFTEHIAEIEKSNTGAGVDISKILNNIFIEPFLDIGKAFGVGKTNSWRERVGRGLWGAVVGWWTLYIFWSIARGFGSNIWWSLIQYTGKSCVKIGMLPVEMMKKWLKLSLGKSFLTGAWWSEKILSSEFTVAEKERLVKYAFLHWELSEHKALVIYEKMWSKTIKTLDALLAEFGIKDPIYVNIFKKYSDNKNIKQLLFEPKTFEYIGWRDNVKHMMWDRILRKDININLDNFKKLSNIDDHLLKFAPKGSKEGIFRQEFLKNTKTLERVEEFMKNKKMMWSLIEVSSTSKDYIELSKILAKNFSQFKTLDEVEGYLNFLKTQKGSITNTNTFIRNTIGKRNEIKLMSTTAQTKYIETAKFNTSFLERQLNAIKNNFKKSSETLRSLIKNKKTPYPQQVETVANNLEEVAKASNEDVSLLAETERMWSGNWVLSMSKNTGLVKELSPLFKDDIFLKELSNAKTQQAIKELFASKWINGVPEEFATALSKTSNTTKLVDTMKYVERYETLGKLSKILQNPSMKYAGRMLWRALWIGTVLLWWALAYNTYEEWSKLKLTNKERWELMQEESFVDIWLTAAWACAFIPGIWRVAAWVIVLATGIASWVKEALFDTLDKYNKNYKDFINATPLLIKQHILTTQLGSSKEDRNFGDWLVWNISGNAVMKYLAMKTWSEAIKALLYTEEWKKNQLAMMDINDAELMDKLAKENPPTTRVQIAEAKDQVEKNVQTKYGYLEKKCGAYDLNWKHYINVQKFVSVDKIKNGEWMKALDQLLLETEYALANPESFWDPEKIVQHQKEVKEKLDQNKKTFELLEWLFTKDRPSLLYMYRYLPNYKQHLEQFGIDAEGNSLEPQHDTILRNIVYFDAYMQYKTLEQWTDVASNSVGFVEPNFILTRDFFATFNLNKPIAEKEIYNSPSKLQTILYRIATEVIGAKTNNTMEDIKDTFNESNEKTYGLYFNKNKLDVNGNYFTDTEYLWTDVATIKKIRADIQEQIKDGDLIKIWTGTKYLNNEIGNAYLKIIDQELARN